MVTNEELDQFLESIGGLENGYYPDKPPIMSSDFFETMPGWNFLIKRLITNLIDLGWNKQICQVKEKFGGLRFYINEGSEEMRGKIISAEAKSFHICEVTGKLGKIRKDLPWKKTLCEAEYLKRKKIYDDRTK